MKNTLVKLLTEFFSQSKSYTYKKGEIILRPDETPSGIYIIEKGHVKVYSLIPDGDAKLHIIYTAGELFPLIWIFRDIRKNSYYEAMDEVMLRKRSKEEFLRFIKHDADLLFELLQSVIVVYDMHIDRVDTLESSKAYHRVIARLLSLAKRFGTQEEQKVSIHAPITHKDIAHSINLRHETFSRELEKLKRKGLVKIQSNAIVITDLEKLQKELAW